MFLHGSPGFPVYPIMKAHDTKLEQFFDVCYWDQRGAGMSYNQKRTNQPLTVEQFVDDTIKVIHYLRETLETLRHIWTCPNDTMKERMNILKANYYSYQSLARDMAQIDLVKLVPTLNLPIFILHGLHDYQTTHTQAKRFYESVEAHKKMFTFENSAHSPFIDEPELFYKALQEILSETL